MNFEKTSTLEVICQQIREIQKKIMTNNNNILTAYFIGLTSGAIAALCLVSALPDFKYMTKMYLIDLLTETSSCETSSLSEKSNHVTVSTSLFEQNIDEYKSRVLLWQIDRSRHLNNSMYLYELNFSRRQFFNKLGLWKLLKEMKANMVIQAQTIRYRRELRLWQQYSIVTRIVQLSERDSCFFLESRFVSLDGFVAAVHHAKYRIVGAADHSAKQPTRPSPVALLKAAKLLPEDYVAGSSEWDKTDKDLTRSDEDKDADLEFVELWEAANGVSSRALNPARKAQEK